MTNYLRPDELATQSEIRKAKTRTSDITSGLKTAASLGTTGLVTKAATKILPFLNEYIPEDLAFKGINKVMPGLGDYLKNGMKQGLSLKSGLDFLKNEFTKQKPAEDNRNIIQKYSDKLHAFIEDHIKKGRSPLEAGALAQIDPEYKKVINKIERDHKTNWSNILQTIYGGQQQQQQGQNPPPVSSGTADEALMMALDKILKM